MGSASNFQPIISALLFGNVFLSVYFGLEWDRELKVSCLCPLEEWPWQLHRDLLERVKERQRD